MISRVMLAHSMFWPNVTRIAIAFRRAGFAVHAVRRFIGCNPQTVHSKYRPTSRYKSIKDSIAASVPDLIVPCDDRNVAHLHRIYRNAASACDGVVDRGIKSLIETSLGSPDFYELVW